MALGANGIVVSPSEACRLQMQDADVPGADTANWVNIPGIGSYRETGGEAPTREVVAFEAAATLTGRRRPPTCESDVASYNPHLPIWKKIRTLSDSQALGTFRFRTKAATIAEPAAGTTTIAIAAADNGVIAIAGTSPLKLSDPDFAPGVVIIVGATHYILVDKGEGGGDKTGDVIRVVGANGEYPPAAANPMDIDRIVRPALIRGPFSAKVAVTDRGQVASESNMISTLRLQPSSELPQWTFDVND